MYVNKVWLRGHVRTHPKIRNISDRTKLTSFMISVMEEWEGRDGERKSHRNDVTVEVLGRDAESIFDKLSPGDWVTVDGYLRSEQYKGRTSLTVRVFNIDHETRNPSQT